MCIELKEKFNLQCYLKFNKSKPIIGISGYSYEQFLDLVEPHILPSMKGKLPSPRKKVSTTLES